MTHFAKINDQGVVVDVVVAEQDFIDTAAETGMTWLQTSYNTYGGVHLNGQTPLRKNYAGIGFTYDAERDAFIPPQPFASWVLDDETCLWNAPTPYPDDGGKYEWFEETQQWNEILSGDE